MPSKQLFTSAFESSCDLASKLSALILQFSIYLSPFRTLIYRLTSWIFVSLPYSPGLSKNYSSRLILIIIQGSTHPALLCPVDLYQVYCAYKTKGGKKGVSKNRSSEIELCKKLALKCFYRLLWKCLPL